MRNWTHTLTIIVPESLMAQANQLALAIGTSEDDVSTFRVADWTDGTSNYAVAHTCAVEQIMEYFSLMPVKLASGVIFPTLIRRDMGLSVFGGNKSKIQIFVDYEPFTILSILGLSRLDQ